MKVLVTGCSGLLGSNLCYLLRDKYQLIGSYNQKEPLNFSGEKVRVDIRNEVIVKKVLDAYKPDVIIHCAGLTNVDACEDEYNLTREVNALGTKYLVENCDKKAKFIFISSDAIFDGKKGSYTEKDLPFPLNNYAKTKLEGEGYVQQKSDNFLILRTNFFGWNYQNKLSFAEWILDSLLNKKIINMVKDWHFSPILVNNLVKIITQLIYSDAKGIYHLAANNHCSKHEFAVKLAEIFGLNLSLIKAISFNELSLKAKRPKNMSLDCSKIRNDLKIELPSYEASLNQFYHLWGNNYRENLRKQ